MPLVKDGAIHPDPWVKAGDEEALPGEGHVFVSLARWQGERGRLTRPGRLLGLLLPNTVAPREIADDLGHFAAIALTFPKFSDGRAYSQAQLLRTRHGYDGELRATGHVLQDQLLHMRRVGFDAFEIPQPDAAARFAAAMAERSLFYQPAPDGMPTILQQRLQRLRQQERAA